ncbi:MAG: NAD(P)-dependent oxidoreductase [Muribaculaceae bacterium]|nr:NAD(P)-dependent oxidoreductase [Muribaculaceae bacterium]
MAKKRVCVTGATGTMGLATLREFMNRTDRFDITVFARPGKVNERKLAPFLSNPGFSVVWGDLTRLDDVRQAVRGADFVLHIGGMVSPSADYYPEKTLLVNVAAAENVARAVLEGDKADSCGVVYIGSVAQSGDRRPPHHWGRTGDPLAASEGDAYALSKIRAEIAIVDSGLKKWACLRQTGILYPGLLFKGSDPITFHVPLRGMLEWATDEDSGRLMANICEDSTPDEFWNGFYNIGSGKSYRLTNYEFEKLLLKALGCPPPHKSFRVDWFAIHNFHGQWWQDSDRLEELVPFRSGESCDDYFRRLAAMVPWYFKLAPLAPAALVRMGMKWVAGRNDLGPLHWRKNNNERRIRIHFGSLDEWDAIPSWENQLPELEQYPAGEPRERRDPPVDHAFDHGYDESKPRSEWNLDDMRSKAAHEGGECLSESMTAGDLHTPLRWRCVCRHEFKASPAAVLLGGHWCPDCLTARIMGSQTQN